MGQNAGLSLGMGVGLAAALGIGALLGGVIGTLLASSPETRSAADQTPPAASPVPHAASGASGTDELELLLGVLIDEVRALRTGPGAPRQAADPAARPEGEPAGADSERLIAAVEALTRAVQSGGGVPGGRGAAAPTIVVPRSPPRFDLLSAVAAIEDDHERVRPYLLWTHQQVLDHFGPPTEVYSLNGWMYTNHTTTDEVHLQFEDGLLIRIN